MIDVAQSLSGFAVGIIVGVTGVGGGSLMTPLLVLVFGIHPAIAVGTDLLHAAVTKAGGTLVHARNGNVEWPIVYRLATGSLPASILTLSALHFWARSSGGSKIITGTLGAMLLLTAVVLVFRNPLLRLVSRMRIERTPHPAYTILTGAFLGVVVSLSSVGAGALGITALMILYSRLPTARIVGSDVAHAVPLTLAAGVGYWLFGTIDWSLLGSLLLGSIPGILLGSHFAGRLPERVQRSALAVTLSLVGVKLIAS